jgi:hypothetical protein
MVLSQCATAAEREGQKQKGSERRKAESVTEFSCSLIDDAQTNEAYLASWMFGDVPLPRLAK